MSPLLSCFADKISYKCLKLDFGFRFQPVEISFEIVSLIQLNKYMHIQNLFFSENNLSVFIACVDIIWPTFRKLRVWMFRSRHRQFWSSLLKILWKQYPPHGFLAIDVIGTNSTKNGDSYKNKLWAFYNNLESFF